MAYLLVHSLQKVGHIPDLDLDEWAQVAYRRLKPITATVPSNKLTKFICSRSSYLGVMILVSVQT
jgi:hypothetical protein